jgi:hypothetical protein
VPSRRRPVEAGAALGRRARAAVGISWWQASEPDRETRHHGGAGPATGSLAQASALGGSTAGAPWVDGRQLGADRLDQVAVASLGHADARV